MDAAGNPPITEAGEQHAPASPREDPPPLETSDQLSVSSQSSRSERITSRGRRIEDDAEVARDKIRRLAAERREKELQDVAFNSPEINDLWYATRIADLTSARDQNQAQGLVITEATRRIRDITPGISRDVRESESDRRDDRRDAAPRKTREGNNPRDSDTPRHANIGESSQPGPTRTQSSREGLATNDRHSAERGEQQRRGRTVDREEGRPQDHGGTRNRSPSPDYPPQRGRQQYGDTPRYPPQGGDNEEEVHVEHRVDRRRSASQDHDPPRFHPGQGTERNDRQRNANADETEQRRTTIVNDRPLQRMERDPREWDPWDGGQRQSDNRNAREDGDERNDAYSR